MISLLCPTRHRPEQCKRMVESVLATSVAGNVSIILGVQDAVSNVYASQLSSKNNNVLIATMPEWPTVHSWNSMAISAMKNELNNLFMLASDDIIFSTPGWDEAIINHYNQLKEKIHVYHFQDSRDIDGTPHPIVSREYIDALGYFLPPIFLHWHVDSWTVSISRSCNVFTHLREYELIHDKPSDRGQPDETHTRIRKNGWRERDAHVNHTCGHFLGFERNRLAKILTTRNLQNHKGAIGLIEGIVA